MPCKEQSINSTNPTALKPKPKKSIVKAQNTSKKTTSKPKFHMPKPTKIYAPKKYTTRPNQKMDFMIGYNKDGSEFVYMEGEFGLNTYKNFLKFLKQSSTTAKEIKINSNGGVLSVAMQIGSYIYEHNWDTGVDKEMHCYSACSFVYFAGKEKSLQGMAKIGLHRPYYPDIADTQQSILKTRREYVSYWNYIKAPIDLYYDMMDVPRDELLILDRNNIEDYIDIKLEN
jgi:hypothetical protein